MLSESISQVPPSPFLDSGLLLKSYRPPPSKLRIYGLLPIDCNSAILVNSRKEAIYLYVMMKAEFITECMCVC